MVKTTGINIRVPASVKTAIKRIADDRLTSESEIVREAVIWYLKQHDVTPAQLREEPVSYKSSHALKKDTEHKIVQAVKDAVSHGSVPPPVVERKRAAGGPKTGAVRHPEEPSKS